MSKILKNVSASPITINDVGILIAASTNYTIPPQDYALVAASVNIDTYINNGTIVINDGYDDLKSHFGRLHIHEESIPRASAYLAAADYQATANSTKTLTDASRLLQIFSGSVAGQIVKLPSATTLQVGHKYEIWNTSTQAVTIQNNGSTAIYSMSSYSKTWLVLQDNSTSNGTWLIEGNFLGGTGGGNGTIAFGFDGTASTGRWLETLTNNASNNTPYCIAGSKTIRALSLRAQSSATATITLYKNGVLLDTIAISAQNKNTKLNLNHVLVDKDELSAQVTAGSCSRPVFVVWL